MLRRLAALPAREEALEPAAEPDLELVFFPRALPEGETPGNENEKSLERCNIWHLRLRLKDRNPSPLFYVELS